MVVLGRVPQDTVLEWDAVAGSLLPRTCAPAPQPPPPLIIDSWLVSDSRVRGIEHHLERFAAACAAVAAIGRTAIEPFLTATIEAMPTTGRWFPRLELWPGEPRELALRLRPAPPPSSTARVWVARQSVERRAPLLKGPDLELLGRLRGQARTAGADEALLLDAEGSVLEGAANSVVWWRGTVLCLPPPASQVLAGVTRELLLELVRDRGGSIRYELATPSELCACETWLTNALHGIRPVTHWVDTETVAAPAPRAKEWRRLLDGLASNLLRPAH